MLKIITKILPVFILWGIFIYIVFIVPYPESLTQANYMQIIPFFVSLYLALLFTLNSILKNILLSIFITISVILLLFLKALNSLNLVTGLLIIISAGLLFSYFLKGNSPTVYFKKSKREVGGIGIRGIRGSKRNHV